MKAKPTFGVVLLIGVLSAMVLFAAWGAWASWRLAGDAPMSLHGWIAMGIAGVVTALLTGVLMWLAFYSSRKGYDDDQRY